MESVTPATLRQLDRLASTLEMSSTAMFSQTAKSKRKVSAPVKMAADVPKEPQQTLQTAEEHSGERIEFNEVMEMKELLFGGRLFIFSDDWKSECFMLQSLQSKCPYGLISQRSGPRGIIMCVQAQMLRLLLYKDVDLTTDNLPARTSLPKPLSVKHQQMTLVEAMAAILWNAGCRKRAVVATLHLSTPGLLHTDDRRVEHVTNILRYHECCTFSGLRKKISEVLPLYTRTDGGGVLMFLYSLMLSRTLTRLKQDLQGDVLLLENNYCSTPLLNLMICGQATPYTFNSKLVYGLDGKALKEPLYGVQDRCDVGLLIVFRDKTLSKNRTDAGSMLKTPRFPIWVVNLNNSVAVLFSTNINLNRDWKSEQKFDLHYYNGQLKYLEAAKITVDSRNLRTYTKSGIAEKRDPKAVPLVEECILKRWPGSQLNWNGTIPYM